MIKINLIIQIVTLFFVILLAQVSSNELNSRNSEI